MVTCRGSSPTFCTSLLWSLPAPALSLKTSSSAASLTRQGRWARHQDRAPGIRRQDTPSNTPSSAAWAVLHIMATLTLLLPTCAKEARHGGLSDLRVRNLPLASSIHAAVEMLRCVYSLLSDCYKTKPEHTAPGGQLGPVCQWSFGELSFNSYYYSSPYMYNLP